MKPLNELEKGGYFYHDKLLCMLTADIEGDMHTCLNIRDGRLFIMSGHSVVEPVNEGQLLCQQKIEISRLYAGDTFSQEGLDFIVTDQDDNDDGLITCIRVIGGLHMDFPPDHKVVQTKLRFYV
jgi:hypothetical protein